MRIIAGEFKSRKLQFPKTKLTRPMTDRAKETLFNIVGSLVDGKRVLDLYSGSGSVGCEALSRGALDVTFVDSADWATKVIRQNLKSLGIEYKAEVHEMDVLRAIKKFEKNGRSFSLIFVDPPYDQGLVKKTLNALDQSAIVAPFAQVCVGHSKQEKLPEELQSLKLARTKQIGQSFLSFYFRLESLDGETKSYLSGKL